jgi:hypothetical protein
MGKQIAFAVFVLAAHALFFYNLSRSSYASPRSGKPGDICPETWGQRITSLVTFFFGQRKVMEERSASTTWRSTGASWCSRSPPRRCWSEVCSARGSISGMILGDTLYGVVRLAVDVMNAVVFVAIAYALVSAIRRKPKFIPANLDAMLILGAITTLVLTHYGHHAWAHGGHGVTSIR